MFKEMNDDGQSTSAPLVSIRRRLTQPARSVPPSLRIVSHALDVIPSLPRPRLAIQPRTTSLHPDTLLPLCHTLSPSPLLWTHELLASLILILGLFKSSLRRWLCSVSLRSLSSDMDCLCGREDMVWGGRS